MINARTLVKRRRTRFILRPWLSLSNNSSGRPRLRQARLVIFDVDFFLTEACRTDCL